MATVEVVIGEDELKKLLAERTKRAFGGAIQPTEFGVKFEVFRFGRWNRVPVAMRVVVSTGQRVREE
jgi:hypothetical protein